MELKLVRQASDREQSSASAWLLTSERTDIWIREIVRWENCQADARVHILPQRLGMLVTLGQSQSPPADARVVPYQSVGRLYFPLDARTLPPVDKEDVDNWLTDGIAVLHPVAGFIHFAAEDVFPITALLSSPNILPVRWNIATPGNVPPPRLLAIQLTASPETVQAFLEHGRGDIGQQPLMQAPSFPEEEQQPIATRASHALQEQFYKALEKMTGQNNKTERKDRAPVRPSSAHGRLLSRLGEWATARLAKIESNQKREMNRLLHLLKTDPDAGLRFAPPLGGRGYRGRMDLPSSSLIERDPEFSLAGLAGGHAASPWQIDFQVYERLRREYREAANRELRLARYRRAAYIFANLLEDFPAAAKALTDGGHFREAALLYRDIINAPLNAAECFWEAGDMDSAEPLFVEQGKFERLGQLYARLGREDSSRAAYRRAADRAAQLNDFIKAGRILVEHLDATEEAVSVLRNGWPLSEQAKDCVKEEFALLAKAGRHADAAERIQQLIHQCPARRHLGPPLIEVLGSLAESYPIANVRALASDLVRVETGRRISRLSANEAARVLAVMRSLSPHDRLLLRDTQRFLTARKDQLLPAPPPRPQGAIDLKLFNIISLPNDAAWLAVAGFPGGYYGIGVTSDQRLVLIRKIWLGRRINVTWPYPFANRRCSLSVPPGAQVGSNLPVHIGCQHALVEQSHPVQTDRGELTLRAGSLNPSGTQSEAQSIGFTFAPTGEMWELTLDGDAMLLKSYDSTGQRLLATAHTASLFGADDPENIRARTAPVPMASIDGQVFFAFRSFVCRYHDGDFAWLELPDAITELKCGVANGQPILAAAMATSGIGVISCGALWGVWEHHAADADHCSILFLHDGLLAVANTRVLELYRVNPTVSETRRCARESVKLPNLLGILPGDEPDVIVLMTSLQSHYYRLVESG